MSENYVKINRKLKTTSDINVDNNNEKTTLI